ncbi:hypothetical protein FQA39_LY11145 [Lamprigera yunnana]|nr:hypothetical protein FQA39_LY11145 [Lamprigera yunnana]
MANLSAKDEEAEEEDEEGATTDQLINILKQRLNNNGNVEIHHILSDYTVDVIAFSLFGLEPNTLENGYSDFQRVAHKFFNVSIRDSLIRTLMVTFPNLLSLFKVSSIHKDIGDFFISMVTDVINYQEQNGIVREDIKCYSCKSEITNRIMYCGDSSTMSNILHSGL